MKPAPPPASPALLTIPEVAAELRSSPATIYRMIADGQLIVTRIRGKVSIQRRDLDTYLDGAREQHTPDSDAESRGARPERKPASFVLTHEEAIALNLYTDEDMAAMEAWDRGRPERAAKWKQAQLRRQNHEFESTVWFSIPLATRGEPYEIGDAMEIRRKARGSDQWELAPSWVNKDGRPQVLIDGLQYSLARVIAETIYGPRPTGEVVRHLDDDVSNSYASNLAYGTPRDNSADAIRNRKRRRREAAGERQSA